MKNSSPTTPRLRPAPRSKSSKASKAGALAGGASRIPCPSPVVSPVPVSYICGLDKLTVSLWLDWDDGEFRQMLRDFKDEFEDDCLCGPEVTERAFDLGWNGVSFNMSRFSAGKYPYKLQSGDITLLFSNHKSTAQFPNCRIEIGSMSCWLPGWKQVFDRFLLLLKHLGGSVRKQNVTEFHITADLLEVDYTKTGFIDHNRWIVKAPKRIAPVYEYYVPSYLAFGKGDFMMRCYDKTGEVKGNPVKQEFFQALWAERLGHVPEHVTRIEFQIRRAVSKELEINTVDDLKSNLDAVWAYCVGSEEENGWARFCVKKLSAKDRKNKNQQRYETASLWKFVQSVRFSAGRTVRLDRNKIPPQVNFERLQKTATGCFLSYCAALGMNSDDWEAHFEESSRLLFDQIRSNYKKDREEYVRKMDTKYNAACISLFN